MAVAGQGRRGEERMQERHDIGWERLPGRYSMSAEGMEKGPRWEDLFQQPSSFPAGFPIFFLDKPAGKVVNDDHMVTVPAIGRVNWLPCVQMMIM